MQPLNEQTFAKTTEDSEVLSPQQCQELLLQLPSNWQLEFIPTPRLVADFDCEGFVGALKAAEKITALAEAEDHHPELVLNYGQIKVTWWSHNLNGLHNNDFIMALRTSKSLQD